MSKFRFNSGIFNFEVQTNISYVQEYLNTIYSDYPRLASNVPVDYFVRLESGSGLRRFIKPQCRFYCDQNEPFKPLPLSQAHAFLEWGMNYCVTAHENNYLILHAAVLAKNGQAIMFPAPPGSGKSTLTAYLALQGWRLLSDEMTIIDLNTDEVQPFVRPICLKNQSINLVKSWFPDATFSAIAKDTQKGDVCHLKPSSDSIVAAQQKATLCAVVYPKYVAHQDLVIYQLDQASTFVQLAENAFNFNTLGKSAFDCVSRLMPRLKRFEILYGDLKEVLAFLDEDVLQ